jgi:hypothetical protein
MFVSLSKWNSKSLFLATHLVLFNYLIMKKKHEQTSMISIIKKINKILPSKIDFSIFTSIHIRFSQNKPSYKSKHEHLKPDNVLTTSMFTTKNICKAKIEYYIRSKQIHFIWIRLKLQTIFTNMRIFCMRFNIT